MTICIANAPVSFGIFEPEFGETKQLPYRDVLRMIADSGYEGTELGPYGYLPTEPNALRQLMKEYNLKLGSSFVPIELGKASAKESARTKVRDVARLLASQGVREVILADAGDPQRRANAGFQTTSWSDAEWSNAFDTLDAIATDLAREFEMSIVIHHHAGTYLETPSEIARLLENTSADAVNLLLDTGHYVYGGGDPLDLYPRFADRVRYVHYKDADPKKLAQVRHDRVPMDRAWRENVFVPLGKGCIDFSRLTQILREQDYRGWIVVEQDTVADDSGTLSPDPFVCAKESRAYLKTLGL